MKVGLSTVNSFLLFMSCFMTSLYGASVHRATANTVVGGLTHTQTTPTGVEGHGRHREHHKGQHQERQPHVYGEPQMDSTQLTGDFFNTVFAEGSTSLSEVTESLPTEMPSASASIGEATTDMETKLSSTEMPSISATTVMPVRKCRFKVKDGKRRNHRKEKSKYDDSEVDWTMNRQRERHEDDYWKTDRSKEHHKDDFYGNGGDNHNWEMDREGKHRKGDFHGNYDWNMDRERKHHEGVVYVDDNGGGHKWKMDRKKEHHKDDFHGDDWKMDRKKEHHKDDFHGDDWKMDRKEKHHEHDSHRDDKKDRDDWRMDRKMKHRKDDFYGVDDDSDDWKMDKGMEQLMEVKEHLMKVRKDQLKMKEHEMGVEGHQRKEHPKKCSMRRPKEYNYFVQETTEIPTTTVTVETYTETMMNETNFDEAKSTQAPEMSEGNAVGDVVTTTSSLSARGSGNTGETNVEEETTTKMSTDEQASTSTTTEMTVDSETETVENNNSTCQFHVDCYSDDDCNGGKCIGMFAGTCNCKACHNLRSCHSDYGCGGLRGACDMKVRRCNCQAAFRAAGFGENVDSVAEFCLNQSCNRTSDTCHGLPCMSGKCFC